MARIRTIKPAFFTDLTMAELPIATRLTYIGLWTYVDDEGRGVDDARLIKAALWPLDDGYTVKKVEADLTLLANHGRIIRYEADGRHCFVVANWAHQKISHPQKSSLPVPGIFPERSGNVPGTIPEQGGNPPGRFIPSRTREEGKGRDREQGKDIDKSSSQNPGVAPAEEDHPDIKRALGLVAKRRHAKLSQPVPEGLRRDKWLTTTAANAYLDKRDDLHRWCSEGLSAEQMADRIEPAANRQHRPFVVAELPERDPGQTKSGLDAMKGALRK